MLPDGVAYLARRQPPRRDEELQRRVRLLERDLGEIGESAGHRHLRMLGAGYHRPGWHSSTDYDLVGVDQIAFSTLLMGLLVGVQPVRVELAPNLKPAGIVYYLDGNAAGGAAAPPWEARVDFGRSLRPHELVAVAVDAQGDRIASVSRVVNLPAPAARLDILIERSPSGVPVGVRLVASSVRREKPLRLSLALDEGALTVDESGYAALPALDLKQTHVLSGVAQFAEDAIARSEVAIGGEITEESGSRLTAVPIRVPPGSNPTADGLKGRFRHSNETLRIAAVERGDATVLLVRHPSSERAARTFGPQLGTGLRLDDGDRVGLVWPVSHEETIGDQKSRLIESSPFFSSRDESLFSVLTKISRQPASRGPFLYADAVGVAGLLAYQAETRRAVVLLGIYPDDASQFAPAQVRGYLRDLGVPLHVWSYDQERSPWGEAETLHSYFDLQRAMGALKRDLDSQRVVWIAGEWQPGQIELAPGSEGVSLLH